MADPNPTDCDLRDPISPAAEDAVVERAVLGFLLDQHPDRLTLPELSLTLNVDPGAFAAEDAVERAVRELVGGGLLRCVGGFVLPTRPALYFARLELD